MRLPTKLATAFAAILTAGLLVPMSPATADPQPLTMDALASPIAPSDDIPVNGTYDGSFTDATVAVALHDSTMPDPATVATAGCEASDGTYVCTIDPTGNLSFGDYTVVATLTTPGGASQTTSQPVAVQPLKAKGCAIDPASYGSKAVVTIGSWNIAHAVVTADEPGWTWANRRAEAVDYLVRCAADVYNLQELGASFLPLGDQMQNEPRGTTQYEQLLRLLNEKLKETGVRDRYAYTDDSKGAVGTHPNDNRILYNSKTVELIDAGFGTFSGNNTEPETLPWGKFKTLPTATAPAAPFFVATTHLTSGSGQDRDNLRRTQMTAVLAKIKAVNTAKHPTILTGDFNSSRYVMWANATDLPGASSLKLVDTIGTDRTIYRPKKGKPYRGSCLVRQSNLRVPYTSAARRQVYYNTSNGSSSTAPPTKNQCPAKWNQNGRAIDYMFTSRNIRPKTFQTVVPADGAGYYKVPTPSNRYAPSLRRTPSDHNMIVSKMVLIPSDPAWR